MAECLQPYWLKRYKDIKGNIEKPISVPCGKCPPCLRRRVSAWSFRLQQQIKVSDSCQFITLTLNDVHINTTPKGLKTLVKSDVQKFFKALRRLHDKGFPCVPRRFDKIQYATGPILTWPKSIKYFAVGEYGGKRRRPHYHAIIFNSSKKLIAKAWTKGFVHYGRGEAASIGYTLKYMMKFNEIKSDKSDDRLHEFQLMSKGLGVNYVSEKTIEWHKADLLERHFLQNGPYKLGIPRYYKDRLYSAAERTFISDYYKAKLEQKLDEWLARATEVDFRSRIESNKAAFRKMYAKAELGRHI